MKIPRDLKSWLFHGPKGILNITQDLVKDSTSDTKLIEFINSLGQTSSEAQNYD